MSISLTVFSFAKEAVLKDREKARIYAKYHAHDLYGDTRENRKKNCVNESKEEDLIESITHDTDMWWAEGIGICEDNVYFFGNEKIIKNNNKWYIAIPNLELQTHINSGMNRIFCNRKEMKRALGDKYFNLSKDQKNVFVQFWAENPNGIVIIGKVDTARG